MSGLRSGPLTQVERDERPGGEPLADDLPALRLVKVPDWEPFAAEPAAGDFPDSGTRAADAGQVPRDAGAKPREVSSEWAQQFARLLIEALTGARPVRQILPWTSERARVHLGRLAPLFGGAQRPRVLRVITTRPTREVIEMTVIVGLGTRTRALAIRLEQAALHRLARPAEYATRGGMSVAGAHRWVCTDIEAA